MNDNFKCIYRILKTLEAALDYSGMDLEEIGYERLGISKERWVKYLEMMIDMGLIKGIDFRTYVDGEIRVINNNVRITLAGLEYLSENTIMQRIYRTAIKAKDIVK